MIIGLRDSAAPPSYPCRSRPAHVPAFRVPTFPGPALPGWSACPQLWPLAGRLVAGAAVAEAFRLARRGRYVGIARDMLASGQWVVPELNGLPFFHKPILYYWVEAAGMGLFGVNTFGGRMAPLLGALDDGAGCRLARPSPGGACRLALGHGLAQPAAARLLSGGNHASLDMLVAGCITLTIVLWEESALSESPRSASA